MNTTYLSTYKQDVLLKCFELYEENTYSSSKSAIELFIKTFGNFSHPVAHQHIKDLYKAFNENKPLMLGLMELKF